MIYRTHRTIEEWENSRYNPDGDVEEYISGEWLKKTEGGITFTIPKYEVQVLNPELYDEVLAIADYDDIRVFKGTAYISARVTKEELQELAKLARNHKVGLTINTL